MKIPSVRRIKRLGHALRLCREKCGGTMHGFQAAKIRELEAALRNAADTLDDAATTFFLLRKPIAAGAMKIAAEATRSALTYDR